MPVTIRSYERRRRLAILLSVASVACLGAGLLFRLHLEAYYLPGVAADRDPLTLLHAAAFYDDPEPGSYLLELRPDFSVASRQQLQGVCRAAIGDRLVFARSVTRLQEVVSDLAQDWDVQDAVPGPGDGSIWAFGRRDREVLLRRVGSAALPEESITTSEAPVETVRAFVLEDGAPAVAFRAKDGSQVQVLASREGAFRPAARFDVPGAREFTPVADDGRILILYSHKDDREFGRLRLRVACCPGCGTTPPPDRIDVADPLWIGRALTGLRAVRTRDGLLLVLTRSATLQALRLDPGLRPAGPLTTIETQSVLRKVATYLWPALMMFFSFSLVFLGFTLLRDRRKLLLGIPFPGAPPAALYATSLQRAMAYILDMTLLLPFWLLAVEILDVAPQTPRLDLTDPGWLTTLGLWLGMLFPYGFLLEGRWGQTLGKRLMGIRVFNREGGRARWKAILIRNLARLVEANLVLAPLGMFLIAFTPRRQRLGDLLARTVVLDLSVQEHP